MKFFTINDKDLEAIQEAIAVLRDRIQSRESMDEAVVNEERSALSGLLSIIPRMAHEGEVQS